MKPRPLHALLGTLAGGIGALALMVVPRLTPEMQQRAWLATLTIGMFVTACGWLVASRRLRAKLTPVAQLAEVLEHVDAYVYLKDAQGRHLFANEAMRSLLHASMEDVVGQGDEQFFQPDSVAKLRHNDDLVLREGRTLRIDEAQLQLLNGHTFTTMTIKLPLRNAAGDIHALCGISTDITARQQAEEQLRIAAIAFECQDGIMVIDKNRHILRVNQAFSQITGYSEAEVLGTSPSMLQSNQQPTRFYEDIWAETEQMGGKWQGTVWQQRKDGSIYLARVSLTAVKDARNSTSHWVGIFSNASESQLQEHQRLRNESAHREILVREVHHRIKNNLQGIMGILRQYAQQHPETAVPIHQAIGQVQSIAVIHGLQGRSVMSTVRLCELTSAIGDEIRQLWHTPVTVDIPQPWNPCIVAEKEAVPIALVINELVLNAVKHGGKNADGVHIRLRKGPRPDVVQVHIVNAGQVLPPADHGSSHHSGLQLIAALMPRQGARIRREQSGDQVHTLLELEPPIIRLEQEDPTCPETT
ncbi:sensor histidine kinase [Rhodoferax sp. WC2427]|uniref:sensor histidine kinase n=1 Tax=Rhodoferax sp. WC2427 TaxID=3234144 RepID=UPI003466EB7E